MADVTFVTNRIAVGGGIWDRQNMEEVAAMGITHILDTQAEFDDTPLAAGLPVVVLWCPAYDDFTTPLDETFTLAAAFIDKVLQKKDNRLLIHCAGGVHRGPMFALLACGLHGLSLPKSETLIRSTRLISSFPGTYYQAVERYLEKRTTGS